jgi:hypothetical protein
LTLPVRAGNPPRPARVRVLGNPNRLWSVFSSSDPTLNYKIGSNSLGFGFDPTGNYISMKYYYKDHYNYINISLIPGSNHKICSRVGLLVKRAGKLGGPEAGRSVKP